MLLVVSLSLHYFMPLFATFDNGDRVIPRSGKRKYVLSYKIVVYSTKLFLHSVLLRWCGDASDKTRTYFQLGFTLEIF